MALALSLFQIAEVKLKTKETSKQQLDNML